MQKCSSLTSTHKPFITAGSLELLAMLTESPDLPILHSTLSSLINFGKAEPGLSAITDFDLCESTVTIMLHMDSVSQQLASDLLLLLSQQPNTQQQLKEYDLLPSLLTLLKGKDPHLQQRIVASLERLLEDAELLEEFRQAGGIPLVLSLLVMEEARNGKSTEKEHSKQLSLLCASCSLLTRLAINDDCAVEIVKSNGIYLLATHIMPTVDETSDKETSLLLQQQALRAMRFLFSIERNRQLFKQLFPAHILEKFIDIGHYVYGLSQYHQLATIFASLPPHEAASIQEKIVALNQTNNPLCTIGNYCVLELLGSGAYGSVYKVRKGHSGSLYAMKEISAAHPLLGKTAHTRQESIGEIMSEVAMTKEQLVHPNIVTYYKCFQVCMYPAKKTTCRVHYYYYYYYYG